MDKRELFLCCKTGNLSRLRYLVEEKDVDIHVRDKWDGTPLYYASLCGHQDVAFYLLDNGAQCDANTFDGERCLYAALTPNLKHLLQHFKVICAATMKRDKYTEFLRRTFEASEYNDIQFVIGTEVILAHRSIISCRSEYFHSLLSNKGKDKTCIDISDLNIPSSIFKSVMQYLYMGEVNINKRDLKTFITVAEHLNITPLLTEINKILSLRKKIPVIRVQQDFLPKEDFFKLFLSSLPKELQSKDTIEKPLYFDMHIKVGSYIFCCHKVFICGRCNYLKALVTDHFSETSVCDDNIQVITLNNVDPLLFVVILQYIYTDTTNILPENVLDVLCLADLFILPGLKKMCASVVQENLSTENIISVIKIARLYSLSALEARCIEYMAEHLEEIVDLPEFKNLVFRDANEIKNREEVDTIPVIDEICYHIYSKLVLITAKKNVLITKLLKDLNLEA